MSGTRERFEKALALAVGGATAGEREAGRHAVKRIVLGNDGSVEGCRLAGEFVVALGKAKANEVSFVRDMALGRYGRRTAPTVKQMEWMATIFLRVVNEREEVRSEL